MNTTTLNAAERLAQLCSISSPLDGFPAPVGYINMKTGVVKSRDTLKREPAPGSWLPFNTQDEVHDLLRTQAARIAELEAALAQQVPEPTAPVAWWSRTEDGKIRCWTSAPAESLRLAKEIGVQLEPLYAAPVAQQVPAVPGWREVMQRMVAGIDHLAEIARLWEPDYSTVSDRRGWVLAKDARDDAMRLLAAAPLPAPTDNTGAA